MEDCIEHVGRHGSLKGLAGGHGRWWGRLGTPRPTAGSGLVYCRCCKIWRETEEELVSEAYNDVQYIEEELELEQEEEEDEEEQSESESEHEYSDGSDGGDIAEDQHNEQQSQQDGGRRRSTAATTGGGGG